jgi:hypothetical protein
MDRRWIVRATERTLDALAGALITLLILDVLGYADFSLPIVIVTVILISSVFVKRVRSGVLNLGNPKTPSPPETPE